MSIAGEILELAAIEDDGPAGFGPERADSFENVQRDGDIAALHRDHHRHEFG